MAFAAKGESALLLSAALAIGLVTSEASMGTRSTGWSTSATTSTTAAAIPNKETDMPHVIVLLYKKPGYTM
jgi:hypothetical protein